MKILFDFQRSFSNSRVSVVMFSIRNWLRISSLREGGLISSPNISSIKFSFFFNISTLISSIFLISKYYVFCTLLPKDYHCLDSGKFREGNEGRRWPPPLPIDLNFQLFLPFDSRISGIIQRCITSPSLSKQWEERESAGGGGWRHNARHVLSMASSRPTTNGRQFFITYVKQPHLNGPSFIFGRVTHGLKSSSSWRRTHGATSCRDQAESSN
ncbi:hypothetical protein MRB53_002371 [Persea americana]|uniref:Uncharacterized protein n=1 Tax=Persea americana TaxID=3435 RepID=A0ACC2MV81_PERAE|nr:hypothetical protein MRB53_002371 [Persea americana]